MLGTYAESPFDQFDAWMAEAVAAEINDANAMVLATATPDGVPSLRTVLLRGLDPRGFVFYTNKASRKGDEIGANPHVALLFYWKSLHRQIRIDGSVEDVTDAEADAYYATRARVSRLGAWASDQSRPLETRAALERRLKEVEERFPGDSIPRPPNWSGLGIRWRSPFRPPGPTLSTSNGSGTASPSQEPTARPTRSVRPRTPTIARITRSS